MTGTSEGGKKAAETVKKEKGPDFHKESGQKGGHAADHQKGAKTAEERDPGFQKKIGEKGGQHSHGGGRSSKKEDEE